MWLTVPIGEYQLIGALTLLVHDRTRPLDRDSHALDRRWRYSGEIHVQEYAGFQTLLQQLPEERRAPSLRRLPIDLAMLANGEISLARSENLAQGYRGNTQLRCLPCGSNRARIDQILGQIRAVVDSRQTDRRRALPPRRPLASLLR